MSVNKHLPHVLVLPEDDANTQIANGFLLGLSTRQIQILEEAGGWIRVPERFRSDYVDGMKRHSNRFMILLIDFDGKEERLQEATARIPEDLQERVFILGALSEPEALRRAIPGDYETIGLALAQDCREGTETTWSHDLLRTQHH